MNAFLLQLNQSIENCHASTCSSNDSAKRNITEPMTPTPEDNCPTFHTILECGNGSWIQLASLDFTDESRKCPSPWILTTTPLRSCTSNGSSCLGSVFQVPRGIETYTHVCGHVTGLALGSPDGSIHSLMILTLLMWMVLA